jgi:hypothetical protein
MLAAAAAAIAQENSLLGKWIGYRPTDGYVWEIRYQFEFRNDGTYTYTARQVSPKKPFWKIELTGTYRLSPPDSRRYQAMLLLDPDTGSAGPPTEDDRTALLDILGLPDNRPRKIRIRRSSLAGQFDTQLSDSDPNDGIEQCWYLRRPGGE